MHISIQDLCFSYPGTNRAAVDHFSLTIGKGEVVSILGKSGSGKSTILRLLAGLEKPSKGSLCIQENVVFDDKVFLAPEKRGIGMVFQDYALFPHMTVHDNIKFGLSHLKKEDKKKRIQ